MQFGSSDAPSLAINPYTQAPRTFPKRRFSALEDIAHRLTDMGLIQATCHVRDWGQTSGQVRACIGNDDLICVRVDYQICVVSDDDHLSFDLGHHEQRDEF